MIHVRTDIIIFLFIIAISFVVLVLSVGQSAVDIQLHDTYFVIDKISLTVLIIGPLSFLIFLARALAKKFKTKGPNMGLIIGLILVGIITLYVARLQQSYLSEMMSIDDEGLPDRGQFVVNAKNGRWDFYS